MFDIIIDFPDSVPAIADLKVHCIGTMILQLNDS